MKNQYIGVGIAWGGGLDCFKVLADSRGGTWQKWGAFEGG